MNRHVDAHRRLPQLFSIDIFDYRKCIPCPRTNVIAYLSHGQTTTYGQKHIAVLHGPVARPIAYATSSSHIIRIVARNTINAIDAGYHRYPQQGYQFLKRLIGVGDTYAVSNVEHRPFGCSYDIDDATCDILRTPALHNSGGDSLRLISYKRILLHHGALNILGYIEPNGARPSGRRLVPRPFKMIPNGRRVFHGHGILGHGSCGWDDIEFLIPQSPNAESLIRHFRVIVLNLTGNHDHRNGIEPCSQNACERVCASRTRRAAY